MVIDRPEMMKLISGEHGGTVTCDDPVWPGDQYRTQIRGDADVEGAKALLAEAGYNDGIDITISCADNEPKFIRMIEVYLQQAAKVGIRVKLNMAPSDGYWCDAWMKAPG